MRKETISDKLMETLSRNLREISAPEGVVALSSFENTLAKYEVVLSGGIRDQLVQYLAIDFSERESPPAPGTLINIAPLVHFLRYGSLHTLSLMAVSIRVFADAVQSEIHHALELGKLIRADVKDWLAASVVEGTVMKAVDV